MGGQLIVGVRRPPLLAKKIHQKLKGSTFLTSSRSFHMAPFQFKIAHFFSINALLLVRDSLGSREFNVYYNLTNHKRRFCISMEA
jgi:hypothetical protein